MHPIGNEVFKTRASPSQLWVSKGVPSSLLEAKKQKKKKKIPGKGRSLIHVYPSGWQGIPVALTLAPQKEENALSKWDRKGIGGHGSTKGVERG